MKKIVLTLSAILIFTNAYQQNSVSKAQSILIMEISAMVEWPAKEDGASFTIGILGESQIYSDLLSYKGNMISDGRKIEIAEFRTPQDIISCDILFIPFSNTRLIFEAGRYLKNQNTLIITERSGALKSGAAVNFILTGEGLSYETSPENAALYGLKISLQSVNLAVTR